MSQNIISVGIDVGALNKGFHAVVNFNGAFHSKLHSNSAHEVVAWSLSYQPRVVAIDSPSRFSLQGRSRKAEGDLVKAGMRCFYTPTRKLAEKSHFYDWVFNGEQIYQHLQLPIYLGGEYQHACCIETFPHAIQKMLWLKDGIDLPNESKSKLRRSTLSDRLCYDISHLDSIDFVDAALCAVAGDYFQKNQFSAYGCELEGFIVLPCAS